MRYGPDDKFWCVTDATLESELGDVLFETTLRGLALQLKGGLSMDRNPTIFARREQAEAEARNRLLAVQAMRAILDCSAGGTLDGARRVELRDAKGKLLFGTALPGSLG